VAALTAKHLAQNNTQQGKLSRPLPAPGHIPTSSNSALGRLISCHTLYWKFEEAVNIFKLFLGLF
jgi:hypothetical protein